MPEITTVNRGLGIIEVNSYGVVTKKDWEKTVTEILEINKTHGFDKVLVDTTRQDAIPESIQIFEFGQFLSTESRHIKYAILVGNKTGKDQHFLHTVTSNRGSIYSTFSDNESALKWLFSK